MHHEMLHTWPIFTITTRTGVNTQKCVTCSYNLMLTSNCMCRPYIVTKGILPIKIQEPIFFIKTNDQLIFNNNPESWKYNLLRLFKTIYTGNLEQVPVRQNQLIVMVNIGHVWSIPWCIILLTYLAGKYKCHCRRKNLY
jgi:hypothetical protein